MRRSAVRNFGPSGVFEQDDMDNWQNCTQTSRGAVARRQMLNYQMGMGYDSYCGEFEGFMSGSRYSDNNQLRFYQRWSELMAAG